MQMVEILLPASGETSMMRESALLAKLIERLLVPLALSTPNGKHPTNQPTHYLKSHSESDLVKTTRMLTRTTNNRRIERLKLTVKDEASSWEIVQWT